MSSHPTSAGAPSPRRLGDAQTRRASVKRRPLSVARWSPGARLRHVDFTNAPINISIIQVLLWNMDPTTCDVYQVIFVGLPRNHHAVFVETQEDESGMLYQVTGNVQEGMNFAFERSNKPAKSATFDSNSLMGKLAREDLDRFEEVCRGVPPPKKQFDRAHRLSPQEPLRRCQEWTTEAIQALRSAGLLQK